jgi:hypothetical protein
MGGMNQKRPTAIKGTMNDAKTSVSTEILDGAMISVVQYLAPLWYPTRTRSTTRKTRTRTRTTHVRVP